MKTIQFRMATAADADAIAAIHIAARLDAMPYLPSLHSDEETRTWVRDIVLTTQDVRVAMVDGEVAGYIAVEGSTIESLYVFPAYQGRGIGSALLCHAMATGSGTLDLWTFQRNAGARRFYETHGFQAVEFTDGAENEEREPDVRYTWTRRERPHS